MRQLFSLALGVLLLMPVSCQHIDRETDSAAVLSTLDRAGRLVELYQYDDAVRLGFEALQMAESSPAPERTNLRCISHERLSAIFLQTYRDSLAWEHADRAEQLALTGQNDSLVARALILKGRVCIYANQSAEDNRDDEALADLLRALRIAQDKGYTAIEKQACYHISEVYVNMNRWNNPPHEDLYQLAGQYLEKGERLEPAGEAPTFSHYRMRYLRQGGRTAEAIAYCEGLLEGVEADNYLLRWQIYDHLTNLYLQDQQIDKGKATHQASSVTVQQYMQRKADVMVQEIMGSYELELRNRQIRQRGLLLGLLAILLLLSVAFILNVIRKNRIIARQNQEIADTAAAREHLFAQITRDLSDASVTDIDDHGVIQFIRRWPEMEEEEILQESKNLAIGEKALDPVIIRHIVDLMISRKKRMEGLELTPQEIKIIRLSRKGLSDKQIAEQLCLSPRTISNHKYRIYTKLNVSSNTEMLSKVADLGF